MSYVTTVLTPVEQSKIPTPNYTPLTWDELQVAMSLPSGMRPRTYGYLEDDQQIVAIRSIYDIERYIGQLSFAWLSGTTIADLISRA